MNKLTREARIRVLHALVEGNSLRSTSRMCDVSINTVTKLLVDAGRAALAHQDRTLRNLTCKRLECDEIWAFVGMKDARVVQERRTDPGIGSVWTWVAICAETKVVPTFMLGSRDADAAKVFMSDLASRLTSRVQLTTDGHGAYLCAVDGAFGLDVDYAMLIKQYGKPEGPTVQERRYSPGECTGIRTEVVTGAPAEGQIGTSYVERQNLTMRMSMRRFTRLTNGFSKKEENLLHAVALHFWHYNFARIHKTLRVTPAMAANVTGRLMDLGDLVDIISAGEETAGQIAARRVDRQGVAQDEEPAPVPTVARYALQRRAPRVHTAPEVVAVEVAAPKAPVVKEAKPSKAPDVREPVAADRSELRSAHALVARTQAEKRGAVVQALCDAELCKLSSRRLADHLLVSHVFVQALRRKFNVAPGQVLVGDPPESN